LAPDLAQAHVAHGLLLLRYRQYEACDWCAPVQPNNAQALEIFCYVYRRQGNGTLFGHAQRSLSSRTAHADVAEPAQTYCIFACGKDAERGGKYALKHRSADVIVCARLLWRSEGSGVSKSARRTRDPFRHNDLISSSASGIVAADW